MADAVLVCINLFARTMRCFSKYIIQPIRTLSPYDTGPSIAVGLYGGLFPVPGTTLFVTVILLYVVPVTFSTPMKGLVFAVNAMAFPLEILLLPYFIHAGSSFFNDLDCDPESLIIKFSDENTHIISMIQGKIYVSLCTRSLFSLHCSQLLWWVWIVFKVYPTLILSWISSALVAFYPLVHAVAQVDNVVYISSVLHLLSYMCCAVLCCVLVSQSLPHVWVQEHLFG